MAGKNPARFALLYVETILFEKSAEQMIKNRMEESNGARTNCRLLDKFSLLPLYTLHRKQCGEYRCQY